jgi:hypothetical protein
MDFKLKKRTFADWARAIKQGLLFGAFSSIVGTYISVPPKMRALV